MSTVDAATRAGYVSATPRPKLSTTLRGSRVGIIGLVLFLIIIVMVVLGSRPEDLTPLSSNNSAPNGARAVAEILRDQGVDVRQVSTLGGARITNPADTTLVVAFPEALALYQIDSILAYPGDVVFISTSSELLRILDSSLTEASMEPGEELGASCNAADAVVAGTITSSEFGIAADADTDVTVCFTDSSGVGAYAVVDRPDGTVTVIASEASVTNQNLDQVGNAALVLRSTGRHESVVWYVGDYFDTSTVTWSRPASSATPPPDPVTGIPEGDSSSGAPTGSGEGTPGLESLAAPSFVPPGTTAVLYALGIAALIAALWLARRFGPLVTEPLPVVVRSSESTRGRARLYRRARATGRASAALRAAAAVRMGRRLGVPRASEAAALVAAVARASGRPATQVKSLLYGPAPQSERDMMELITQLDTLESEVHRP